MLWIEFVLILLGATPETCQATVFGTPGDKWAGGDALYLGRPVNDTDVGVAHRTLPGNSNVLIVHRRTGRSVIARVIDRGPYGAYVYGATATPDRCVYGTPGKRCWYVKKRRSWPGKWRGCIDLTPATARAIGHNFGRDEVTVWRYP